MGDYMVLLGVFAFILALPAAGVIVLLVFEVNSLQKRIVELEEAENGESED
jgi:hypothetical protein